MNKGMTLSQMAQEVQRQSTAKKDFVAPTQQIKLLDQDGKVLMQLGDHHTFDVAGNAHAQIADRLKIPKAYYDRLLQQAPGLLVENTNHWLETTKEKRMIRTLDGKARAFLSERYRPLDNYELLGAVLPVLHDQKVEIMSCNVTENNLYLKVIFPDLVTDVPGSKQVGDTIRMGFSMRNSETGHSSFAVEPFVDRLVCTNGMILEHAMRKYHVGRGGHDTDSFEVMRDETRHQTDKAFWMQVQDVVRSAVNTDLLKKTAEKFSEAAQQKLSGNPVEIIEVVRKQFQLSEGHAGDVLRNLIENGDLSRWGLANAVTQVANDLQDYEVSTQLERTGGKIIELSQRDWNLIAKAS